MHIINLQTELHKIDVDCIWWYNSHRNYDGCNALNSHQTALQFARRTDLTVDNTDVFWWLPQPGGHVLAYREQ